MKINNADNELSELVTVAKAAYDKAYAPYSQFNVGASLLTKDRRIFAGCNVENASYGLTVCAERNCIANAVVQGGVNFSCSV